MHGSYMGCMEVWNTKETRVEEKQKEFLCPLSKSEDCLEIFRHGNKNTLSLVMVYSARFNNVFKALNLFLDKYVA
jgi:hypothetical protein